MENDAELAILENIYLSQRDAGVQVTQRELAKHAGVSLGMTNVLLKRFSEKGWLLVRRANARNISYALTPDGINEIARRTFRYFKRTATNVHVYRELIESFVTGKKREGYTAILLVGSSDLDFILEFACERFGIMFMKCADPERALSLDLTVKPLLVFSEGIEQPPDGDGRVSLRAVVTGKA
ncbi:MAG: transcriptional regulator [Spirochaetes bacterium]|nr:transcriptional regulator [Spirochaetota bacterium]